MKKRQSSTPLYSDIRLEVMMFFVVDKPRFQRMIALTRDDRSPVTRGKDAPFLRIEAMDGHLRITGRQVEATFPATVYEPGVLFLRVTLFRQMLNLMPNLKTMAFQIAADGLHFGDTKLPWDAGDMLLYVDPARAPTQHPSETLAAPSPDKKPQSSQGSLFADDASD